MSGLPFAWVYPGVLCAVIAWDLGGFLQQAPLALPEDRFPLEQARLGRLGLYLLPALALYLLKMQTNLGFSFEWTALFILLAAWGMALAIRSLKGRREPPPEE
ncbi:MAG: hypothetical protein FJZ96_12045 [Chloroflexi bacterium]|nr:hypothetical protein [Chloroflexota bacterium]